MHRIAPGRTGVARRAAVLLSATATATATASVAAGAALAGGAALTAAAPAAAAGHTTGSGGAGTAHAVVLRTGLEVSLIDGAARVPLTAVLNEVAVAAGDGERTAAEKALDVTVEGVGRGGPVALLRAGAADARATADAAGTRAEVELADARVRLPGLPLLPVVAASAVAAEADCPADGAPSADVRVAGPVTVLGKRVTLDAEGPTEVSVPGVGDVRLELSRQTAEEDSAAAAALELTVSVDPLDLNVAAVTGTVVLAEADCTGPAAVPAAGARAEAAEPGSGPVPQGADESGVAVRGGTDDAGPDAGPGTGPDLAATGGGSGTTYLGIGALLLLGAGAGLVLARRRSGTGNGSGTGAG
ncbi:SCO1860 family LAETG-anchored protein [Streptomyces aidingensis]|uniref:LPXTG-motif cell wall anchor domain-containing protein n=1 Tax=Streptomyces aidingensis TaxID=910347 RepID=A0A1I1M9N8_9ACTN|nr:SCO1860 family LAETG-anchored protein [Streptomyces aidingensis]SFC79908.1 LPXTG-motif cell wall anchor domain-containing protein [Streptomyces aidingensis]